LKTTFGEYTFLTHLFGAGSVGAKKVCFQDVTNKDMFLKFKTKHVVTYVII